MVLDLSLAVSHHLLIFLLFGILVTELVLTAEKPSGRILERLPAVDVWYGVVAGLILVAGSVRAVYAAKGWAYYSVNLFFWAKIAVFVTIATLSIWPTIRFIQWRVRFRIAAELPDLASVAAVRRVLWLEASLFALLPVFAAAMARRFGQ
jgi:putative membrane protein